MTCYLTHDEFPIFSVTRCGRAHSPKSAVFLQSQTVLGAMSARLSAPRLFIPAVTSLRVLLPRAHPALDALLMRFHCIVAAVVRSLPGLDRLRHLPSSYTSHEYYMGMGMDMDMDMATWTWCTCRGVMPIGKHMQCGHGPWLCEIKYITRLLTSHLLLQKPGVLHATSR